MRTIGKINATVGVFAAVVPYLGERTTEYENGRPTSTEGSFEVPFGHFGRGRS